MKDFAISDNPQVQAQLDRLGALSLPSGRLGLEVIHELLARLGAMLRRSRMPIGYRFYYSPVTCLLIVARILSCNRSKILGMEQSRPMIASAPSRGTLIGLCVRSRSSLRLSEHSQCSTILPIAAL